ncbi:MAG: hypothetical protein ACI91O_001480 [Candidatus Poriferisodalaceae bacterium]|jgi:hypothetical protein
MAAVTFGTKTKTPWTQVPGALVAVLAVLSITAVIFSVITVIKNDLTEAPAGKIVVTQPETVGVAAIAVSQSGPSDLTNVAVVPNPAAAAATGFPSVIDLSLAPGVVPNPAATAATGR